MSQGAASKSGGPHSFAKYSGDIVDHGGLLGLADDDHPQYLLADGSRAAVELTLTPKAASVGPEGTMFYCSTDDHVYVGTEA
jgi:hypothetical protein